MFPRGFGKSEYTGCAASHISIHDGFKAQSERSQTDSFVMRWVHFACNCTEKWNIWFLRGGVKSHHASLMFVLYMNVTPPPSPVSRLC